MIDRIKYIKHIIYFDENASEELLKKLDAANITLHYYKDMIEAAPIEDNPPTPDSILAFSYTSGTTGVPKGVLLTQRTIMAELACFSCFGVGAQPNDVVLSYLPYPHLFERVVYSCLKTNGASMGFY